MQRLAELLRPTDVLVIGDEVYEHMVYDGAHQSAARFPELAARSFVVSSFGKTYHVTGWKVGYAAAPAALMAEFRKVHQFNVFTVNTPMQHGLAATWPTRRPTSTCRPSTAPSATSSAPASRDPAAPAAVRGHLLPVRRLLGRQRLREADFCRWLTTEIGVAAIPLSAFYADGFEQRIARFCFAKKDETLDLALERLARSERAASAARSPSCASPRSNGGSTAAPRRVSSAHPETSRSSRVGRRRASTLLGRRVLERQEQVDVADVGLDRSSSSRASE